jgi:hypothetical protein
VNQALLDSADDRPPAVAITWYAPAAFAGAIAVIWVAVDVFTVAATPPIVRLVAPATKFVPTIVSSVPPLFTPSDGLTEEMVGADGLVVEAGTV